MENYVRIQTADKAICLHQRPRRGMRRTGAPAGWPSSLRCWKTPLDFVKDCLMFCHTFGPVLRSLSHPLPPMQFVMGSGTAGDREPMLEPGAWVWGTEEGGEKNGWVGARCTKRRAFFPRWCRRELARPVARLFTIVVVRQSEGIRRRKRSPLHSTLAPDHVFGRTGILGLIVKLITDQPLSCFSQQLQVHPPPEVCTVRTLDTSPCHATNVGGHVLLELFSTTLHALVQRKRGWRRCRQLSRVMSDIG